MLFARIAVLSPTVQMAHIKALEKWTAKYPIRPVDCKVYSILKGAMSHTHETCSSRRCQNDQYCGASTTTHTTSNKLKTHSTPRTTPLTSWPSTSMDVRLRRNRSSQTLRLAATFEGTSTCFPPPVNNHRTNGTDCRAMNLAKATPYSASI